MTRKNRINKKIRRKNYPPLITREMYDFEVYSVETSSNDDVDRISELPDDILVYILSLLTLREATATKILSTRWGRLRTMPNVVLLKFPFPVQHYEVEDEPQFLDHINRVNHTLDSYTGSRVIKKIRVDIPYSSYATNQLNSIDTINKLLHFALSRETEIIDIHVYPYFSCPFFDFSTLMIIKNLPSLKCLKELSLSGVAMHNGDVRVLLSELVVLQRLLLESLEVKAYFSEALDEFYGHNLEIDGPPTSKLKHLIISNISCDSTYISNLTNLIFLRYDRMVGYTIYLYNLAKLVDLGVHSETDQMFEWNFSNISIVKCNELRRLELYTGLYKYEIKGDKRMITKNNEHIHIRNPMERNTITFELNFARARLKHLAINVVVDEECNLHQLFSLIEGFPYLKNLVYMVV